MRKSLFFLKITLSFSIIIVLIYKYIDIDKFIYILLNINYSILLLLVFLIYVIRLLVAYQTKISLTPFQIKIDTNEVFKIHLISTFYSLILSSDLIAGGVSWYLLSKDNGRRAEVASVIVYLRILNLITLLPFALLGIYFEPKLREYNLQFYILIFGLLLLLMLLPFLWHSLAIFTESLLNYLISLLPLKKLSNRLLEANQNVWNAVKVSREMPIRFNIEIIILSFASQVFAIIFMYLALEMVNIHLSISVATWLLALTVIIAMLPLTIAGIGVRDFSFVFILKELYSVPSESSLLLSMVILLINILFGGILGGYYAMTLGSSNRASFLNKTQ